VAIPSAQYHDDLLSNLMTSCVGPRCGASHCPTRASVSSCNVENSHEEGCVDEHLSFASRCFRSADGMLDVCGHQRAGFPGGVVNPSGSTCDGFQGYCDQGGECVTIESEKLLDRLRGILRNLDFGKVWKWITDDWLRSGGILVGLLKLRNVWSSGPNKMFGWPPPHHVHNT
jgi:hypothetical protein